MAIHGLGPVMTDIHQLNYPLRSSTDLISGLGHVGDIYIKGRPLREIADKLKYPIYTASECIENLMEVSSKLKPGTAPTNRGAGASKGGTRRATYDLYSPRPSAKARGAEGGAAGAAPTRSEIYSYVQDSASLRESRGKTRALEAISAEGSAGLLKSKMEQMEVPSAERELSELELKIALARLRLEREAERKSTLDLEVKKKELEIDAKERERELRNKLDIELKKKLLELEARERERDMRNRMELELKKKELELDIKKRELVMEDEMRAKIQIAVKEREDEIRKKVKAEADAEIERMRKKMEEEIVRKEELIRRRAALDARERAARGGR